MATSTIKNNLLSYDTYVENGIYFEKLGNQVYVYIDNPTLQSDGVTLISSLPTRLRPDSNVFVLSKCYNGSDYVDASFRIFPNGNVTMTNLRNSSISGLQPNYFQAKGTISYLVDY